jgi:hypothetical protein
MHLRSYLLRSFTGDKNQQVSKRLKQSFAVVCLFAGAAFAHCTDPGTRHAIAGNFSVELYGPVDTRPGTYGHDLC